ncbi:hypothetical protein IT570_07770 [Candidatus Sumerlaeota bacterium]|nr:hypothetical protein [Candidatus Sumerlaeota bacterium]
MKTSPASSDTSPLAAEDQQQRNRAEAEARAAEFFRQFRALVRVTRRRMLWSNYFFAIIVMTLPIILVFGFFCVLASMKAPAPPAAAQILRIFDAAFIGAFLHFSLILGGAMLAAFAFHEEVHRQTLHHLFLQPVHRWMIPLAKFTGFMLAVLPIYFLALAISYILLSFPYLLQGEAAALYNFARFKIFLLFMGVSTLGLTIYCSLLLALSMFVKSPAFAILLLGWEAFMYLLPDVLKNFTVSYYLQDMLPEKNAYPGSTIAIISDGPGALQTVLVLGGVILVSHGVSAFMATRKQCLYGTGT